MSNINKDFNDVKDILKEMDGILKNIEGDANEISTGVDFYNAVKRYEESENGEIEQKKAIIEVYNSMFSLAENKVPSILGGYAIDAGNDLMPNIQDIAGDAFARQNLYDEVFENSGLENMTQDEVVALEKEYHEYPGLYDLELLTKELNEFDQFFKDVGLYNEKTGQIDLTGYDNWEDFSFKYENGTVDIVVDTENILPSWEEIYENWKYGVGIIGNSIDETGDSIAEWWNGLINKDEIVADIGSGAGLLESSSLIEESRDRMIFALSGVANEVQKASKTVYDPLILDLGNDGYNIETKENGANFDLDKNGFAEKINWTSKDGFLCLDLNKNGNIDDGGELFVQFLGAKTA